jgi:choline dehydrogenase
MTPLTCDFLIIGAGSAGCVLANRLSENLAHRVILLEAGGTDRDPLLHVPGAVSRTLATPAVNWGYASEPEPGLNGRSVPLFRGKVLGGTSTLNGMIYIRGHARDYDYWRQDGCAGWSYEDVLPYFRKAEANERGISEHHGADGPLAVTRSRPVPPICDAFLMAAAAEGYPVHVDFNGATQEGFGHYDVTVSNGRRWSTATAYLKPVRSRRNLIVITNAEASGLLFEGARVTGAEITKDGQPMRILAARETYRPGGGAAPIRHQDAAQLSGGWQQSAGPRVLPNELRLPSAGYRLCAHQADPWCQGGVGLRHPPPRDTRGNLVPDRRLFSFA